MAKSKKPVREIGEEILLSSDVVVKVIPFPPGLLERINKDNPLPDAPKKTIEVLGGTEEIDDFQNPDYVKEREGVERKRNTLLGEATIELCVTCDLSKYTGAIKKLEKLTSAFPSDPDERLSRFLTEYALRCRGDYEQVITSAITQISISDEEVQERIATFQSELEGSSPNGVKASGSNEVVGLAVE